MSDIETHLPALIQDLAMILGTAALVTIVFQKIRQPVVLGYIVAGVIVGPFTPTPITVTDLPNIKVLAELGVIFLMFSLGLEFTFPKLIGVGVAAAGTAIVEVVLMVTIGYFAGLALGWSTIDSLFLGGILSISSTTIIIKAFDEMGLKTRRFAQIVFGVLIVEDLVAILLLVALSTVAVTQTLFSMDLVFQTIQLVAVVGSWFLLGYFLVPSFLRWAEKLLNNETLTVLSAGLCLILVVVATRFHYSSALGAFIMGSILAETREAHRIENIIRPVRDLFAAVFFVSVGMLVNPRSLTENLGPIALITVVTILGKIFSTTVGALITGQPIKRSVQIGFSLAQIGEFSFIIATLGSTLNVTSEFLYPIAVAVSVITTFTTPFLIRFSEGAAGVLERVLPASVTRRIAGYALWAQNPRQTDELKKVAFGQVLRFLANSLLVALVVLAIARFAMPWIGEYLPPLAAAIAGWIISALVSAPFVWGMFSAFRAPAMASGFRPFGTVSFLGQLATVVFLGSLSSVFFPTNASMILTMIAAAILFFAFYRRLERSYKWFERRFISNLKPAEKKAEEAPSQTELSRLAPWDLYLTRLYVDPNSELVGKSLKESKVRSDYGLNVVAIQRGRDGVSAPGASDVIFPGDELLVLGTDEQIDRFKTVVEHPAHGAGKGRALSDHSLHRILIAPGSELVGRTIRDSGIRETMKGLVVGLERSNFRSINPDPATTLRAGDVLWTVSGL